MPQLPLHDGGSPTRSRSKAPLLLLLAVPALLLLHSPLTSTARPPIHDLAHHHSASEALPTYKAPKCPKQVKAIKPAKVLSFDKDYRDAAAQRLSEAVVRRASALDLLALPLTATPSSLANRHHQLRRQRRASEGPALGALLCLRRLAPAVVPDRLPAPADDGRAHQHARPARNDRRLGPDAQAAHADVAHGCDACSARDVRPMDPPAVLRLCGRPLRLGSRSLRRQDAACRPVRGALPPARGLNLDAAPNHHPFARLCRGGSPLAAGRRPDWQVPREALRPQQYAARNWCGPCFFWPRSLRLEAV